MWDEPRSTLRSSLYFNNFFKSIGGEGGSQLCLAFVIERATPYCPDIAEDTR